LVVGASFIMSTSGVRAAGVHAAAALLDWFTLYPGLNADVRQFSTERTWADLGIALHHTFADRIAVVAQPRLTAGTDRLFGSLGLGLKTRVLPAWYAGLEAEPVLLGRDTTTTLVPWTITAEREQGWHNFVFTIGSSVHQSAPGFFRTFRNDNAYDEILDVAKGHFRIGFAIQRKL
jgi:hypothetical protein